MFVKFLVFTFAIILITTHFTISTPIKDLDSEKNILTRQIYNRCYNNAKKAKRSTTIVLVNWTGTTLNLLNSSLKRGIWTPGCNPERTIHDSQSSTFSNESKGILIGDRGSVIYRIGNDTKDILTIKWNNPFIGKNSYNVDISADLPYTYEAPYPPKGNNAYYVITINKS